MMEPADVDKALLVFKSGGFFRAGRWVTPHALAIEQIGDIRQPRFELIQHDAIPMFQHGALIGFRDNPVSMGIFTQAQVEMILIDNRELSELGSRTEIRPVP
jgi:hypothetical protein